MVMPLPCHSLLYNMEAHTTCPLLCLSKSYKQFHPLWSITCQASACSCQWTFSSLYIYTPFWNGDTNGKQSRYYLEKCWVLLTEVSFFTPLSTPHKISQHCYTDKPVNTIPKSLVLKQRKKPHYCITWRPKRNTRKWHPSAMALCDSVFIYFSACSPKDSQLDYLWAETALSSCSLDLTAVPSFPGSPTQRWPHTKHIVSCSFRDIFCSSLKWLKKIADYNV